MLNYKMLIVDDVSINRRLLREIFKNECDITEASDGQETLDLLFSLKENGQKTFDIIILDNQMPNLTGLQVLERIKSDEFLKDIPVIIITAANEAENELKALELGAQDYIVKPFDSRIVKQRVLSSLVSKEVEHLRIKLAYKNQLQYLLEKVTGGALLLDFKDANSFKVSYSNETSHTLTGYNYNNDAIHKLSEFVSSHDLVGLKAAIAKTLKSDEAFNIEVRFKKGDGTFIWLLLRGNTAEIEEGHKQLFVLLLDITDKVKATEKLNYISQYDELTDIFNRHSFLRHATDIISANPETEYYIGITNIKSFNIIKELYGTDISNKSLCACADMLKKLMPSDSAYARYDGDHFLVCVEKGRLDMQALLSQLCEAVSGVLNGYPVKISLGIYLAKDRSLSMERMVGMAIFAVNSIQEDGNVISFYNEQMRKHALYRQEIINEFPTAFENKEFKIFYQAQFNYLSRSIVGFEALVRWQHPTRGLLTPVYFIDILEKNGYITMLDAYVFEGVCIQLRKWLKEGLNIVPVSVNMSRVTMYRPDLISFIRDTINKYDIPVNLIKIEVTESAYIGESGKNLSEVVSLLKKEGFVVQMDDFGSGYSSFNTLKDIDVDVIKLDMRFLQGEYCKGKAGSILNSVIRMARWINVAVIAEGVETYEQAEYLKSLGCILMQGYYFSKPVDSETAKLQLCSEQQSAFPVPIRLQNADMWSPEGITAVIFSNFLGAAIVLEYCKGVIEIQKVNDFFYAETGLTFGNIKEVSKNFLLALDEADRKAFSEAVSEASKASINFEKDIECRLIKKVKNREVWVRLHMYTVASSEERTLLLARVENISQQYKTQAELDFKNKILYSILDNTPNGITLMEIDNGTIKLVYCNDRICSFTHYTKEQYFGHFDNHGKDILSAEELERFRKDINQCIATKSMIATSQRVHCGDGKYRKFIGMFCYADIKMHDNPVVLYIGHNEEERQGELETRWQKEKYRLLMESYGSVVCDYDVVSDSFNYNVNFPNRGSSFEGTVPNYLEFIKGKIFSPKEYKRLLVLLKKISAAPCSGKYEYVANSFGKGDCWYRMHYVSVPDNEGKVYRIVSRIEDIQAEKDVEQQHVTAEKKLVYRATIDSVTGLLNRASTEEYVNKELSRNIKNAAFCVCDIDNFKSINDTYGHLKGDEFLKRVGSILRKGNHTGRDIIGRVGGDEFVSLLFNLQGKADMISRVELFMEAVRNLQYEMKLDFPITASIGIVYLEGNELTFKDVFRMADNAMYSAKNSGKNKYVVYERNVDGSLSKTS